MRRKVSAIFAVAVAMLLSVALAVPAHAADSWWDTQQTTKPGGNTAYKYGLDYYKKEWRGTPGAYTFDDVKKLNVSPTVNPSATGPSWYLEQQRNRALNPANIPLEGKIIEPGKTVVRPPSTYAPAAKFALGFGGLLSSLGVGMGGTSTPPKNWAQVAQGQGVPSSCTDNMKTCSPDDLKKVIAVTSCGNTGTCEAIGAEAARPSTGIPLLDELFGLLTGQQDSDPTVAPDGHQDVAARGCMKEVGFEYRGENNGSIHIRQISTNPRPGPFDGMNQVYFDQSCTGANAEGKSVSPSYFVTTCIDKSTGNVAASHYSYSGSVNGTYWDQTTGANKPGLCGSAGPDVATLLMIQFYNPMTAAQFSQSPSDWDAIIYSEWINPDPMLNTIEDLTVTTSWDCADANGAVVSYSKSVKKTAVFVAPECPLGSDLIRHDVKASTPRQDPRTIDAGSAAPGGLSAYPDCRGGAGCTMDVYLDGSVCTTARPECHTWPAVEAASPSRIVCKWGGYVVPTSDCRALSNGYKTETGVVFDPRAGTWVAVDTYGNPVAPNPEPWNPTNPTPTPGVNPGSGPTTGTTPATPPSTFPDSGTNPDDGCSSPFWSWNPSEFVKSPVVCALKDSFVPKTDIKARMQTISGTAVTVAPVSWMVAPMVGPSGGGCPNWTVHVAGLSENVVCESSFTGAILGARGPMFGIVASAMIWPLIRGIWYGLIPMVRVHPGSSH